MLSFKFVKLAIFLAILGGAIARPAVSEFNTVVDQNSVGPTSSEKTNDPAVVPSTPPHRRDISKIGTTSGANGDKINDPSASATVATPVQAPQVNNALDQNAADPSGSDKTNNPATGPSTAPHRRDTSKAGEISKVGSTQGEGGSGDKSVDSNIPATVSTPAQASQVNNALDQNALDPSGTDKTNNPATGPSTAPHRRDTSKTAEIPKVGSTQGGSGDKTSDSNVASTASNPAQAPQVINALDQNAVDPSGTDKTNNPATGPSTAPHRRDTSKIAEVSKAGTTAGASSDKTSDANVPATNATPAEAPQVNNALDQNSVEPTSAHENNNNSPANVPSTPPHRRDITQAGTSTSVTGGNSDKTSDSNDSNASKP